MKNKLTKSQILIVQRGASLVAVFTMLVLSFAAVISLSFGWFAKNNQVTANGMHVNAYKTDFDVSYQAKNALGTYEDRNVETLFNDLIAPGDYIDIKVTVTNKGRYDVDFLQFGFETPSSSEDVPRYDEDGNPRYLSTEIYAQLLSVSTEDSSIYEVNEPLELEYPLDSEIPETIHFLRDSNGASRIDFVADMGESASLATATAGGSVTFEIRLTFANTDYDQNIYKGFADNDGICKRRFFFTYDDSPSS